VFPFWDPNDSNGVYALFPNAQGSTLFRGTYTGTDQEISPPPVPSWNATPDAEITFAELTAPGSVELMIQNFEPSFDPSKFSCSIAAVQSDYLFMACQRNCQNSPSLDRSVFPW
jgi:hypothetical protein